MATPYENNVKLPSDVKKLPAPAQDLWREAYNHHCMTHGDAPSQECEQFAWEAVRQSFKEVGGQWVAKDSRPISLADSLLLEFDDKGKFKLARDGYLVAQPRIARTGIQVYKGYEIGRPDLKEVRVYRSPEEVFSKDAIRSYANRPLTLEHPGEMVTAANWDKYSIGHTGAEVLRDGEFIRVPMMVMDQRAIDAVRAGKNELSVGYTADLVMKDGFTESGEAFDAVQKNIRANHLAVVASARGGSRLVIGDDQKGKESHMTTKLIVVDSVSLEMSDTAAAVVQRALQTRDASLEDIGSKLEALTKELGDLKAKGAEEKKASDSAIATKDGEIAGLKKQLQDATSEQVIDARMREKLEVVDRARPILGDRFDFSTATPADIRRAVVKTRYSDSEVKDMSDDYIKGIFRACTDSKSGSGSSNGSSALARSLSDGPAHNAMQAREKAYADSVTAMQNAWKGNQQTKQ